MEIRYIGPFDRVEVKLPTGGAVECAQGDVLEVPDELGASLLDQPTNWSTLVDPADAKVEDLKAELERRGIAFAPKAKKDDLIALLARADAGELASNEDDTGGSPPDQAGDGETT